MRPLRRLSEIRGRLPAESLNLALHSACSDRLASLPCHTVIS